MHEVKQLHGEAAYPLIRLAAEMYVDDEGLDLDLNYPEEDFEFEEESMGLVGAEIDVTEKGKPYFVELPIEFSVTNSGDMWMCAVSERPCGIDLQVRKHAPFLKIAERFYQQKELEYVRAYGEEGFFRIWARREAYGKAIGEGFWGDIPELVECSEQGEDSLVLREKIGNFLISDIEVGDGIYCVVCTEDPGPYPISIL